MARRRIAGAALALLAAIALVATSAGLYESASGAVTHSHEVRRRVYELRYSMLEVHDAAGAYVTTGDAAFRERYDVASAAAGGALGSLHEMAVEPEETRVLAVVEREARASLEGLADLVGTAASGRRDAALARVAGGADERRTDAFRTAANAMLSEEARIIAQRRASARARLLLALAGAAVLALGSTGLLVLAWRRERIHDLASTALAREARTRLSVLAELGNALADARTRAEVVDVIVEKCARAAFADACALHTLEDDGATLELLGQRGVGPVVADRMRRLRARKGDDPTFAGLKAGRAVWAENEAQALAAYPQLADLTVEGRRTKAFWSCPLVADGRPIGLLSAGFYEARVFSADERAFIRTLAHQCGQALLRAWRREREEEGLRRFTTTLRSIGDAVIATDVAGRVTFMNPVAEQVTGWAEGEARGRPLDEVFHTVAEDTKQTIESPVARVLREGAVVGLSNHTVLRAKSGRDIPIDDSGAPIRADDGRMLGVVLVFRDVTKEKLRRARTEFLARAGEALGSSLDYEATLATVAGLAVPTLADWCAVDVMEPGAAAPRQVAVAHTDPAKLRLAREYREKYPIDAKATRGVPRVIRTGESEFYETIPHDLLARAVRDPDQVRAIGLLQLESLMIVPLKVRGRTLGAVTFIEAESGRHYSEEDLSFAEEFARRAALTIENATALREAEEGRRREQALRADAEVASRAKDEFLATVSHELRTPLNAIYGWTVTLRRRRPGEEIDRVLAIIERNARAQTRLITDLLDLSRILGGKLTLRVALTNVADVVRAAVETAAPAADAKAIRVDVEVPPEPVVLVADSDRLQQIVWHLLSNAIKFTPKDGRVTIRARRAGSDVVIEVSDTGAGIPDELLPHVFEPFRQADSSPARRYGGLGLGLSIVELLVTAHGGAVRAESAGPGRGATFVVSLPARGAVVSVQKAPPPAIPPAPAAEASWEARLNGLRLLIVDDEEDALQLEGEVLRAAGAEVVTASSAGDALEKVRILKPDVLVSDIGMPGADGLSLMRRIRAFPAENGGRIPAVALTAYARNEDAERAFAAGYQKHVTKPVDPAELVTVVAGLGRRAQDERHGPRSEQSPRAR